MFKRLTKLKADQLMLAALFLLAMHYWQPNLGGVGLHLPFNAVVSAFLGGYLAFTLSRMMNEGQFYMSPMLRGLLALILGLFAIYPLQLVMGISNRPPLLPFLAVFSGWLFLLSLHQSVRGEQNRIRLIQLMLAAVLIHAVISWSVLLVMWLGFGNLDLQSYSLIMGVFQQPNVMASFLATGLALSFWLAALKQDDDTQLGTWPARLAMIAPMLFVPLLLVLQSRIGWLGSVLVLLLTIIWSVKHRQAIRGPVQGWYAASAVGLAIGAALLKVADVLRRDMGNLVEATGNHRTNIWEICWSLVMEKKWLGAGYGNFYPSFLEHQAEYYKQHGVYGLGNLSHPHNELLMWGSEAGLFPMLAIVAFAVWLLGRWWRNYDRFSLLSLAVLAPIAAHSMTELPFDLSLTHWLFFLSALFLMEPEKAHIERQIQVRGRALPMLIGMLAMVNAAYMLTTLQTSYTMLKFKKSEPGQAPEILATLIIHSVWADNIAMRYQWELFVLGKQNRDAGMIQQYIEAAEFFSERTPRREVLATTASAYQMLGMNQQAEATVQRMNYLFPAEIFNPTNATPQPAHQAASEAGEP